MKTFFWVEDESMDLMEEIFITDSFFIFPFCSVICMVSLEIFFLLCLILLWTEASWAHLMMIDSAILLLFKCILQPLEMNFFWGCKIKFKSKRFAESDIIRKAELALLYNRIRQSTGNDILWLQSLDIYALVYKVQATSLPVLRTIWLSSFLGFVWLSFLPWWCKLIWFWVWQCILWEHPWLWHGIQHSQFFENRFFSPVEL